MLFCKILFLQIMNSENIQLLLLINKMHYYRQLYKKNRDSRSWDAAQHYTERVLSKLGEMGEIASAESRSLYINR
jgi:hypothetical protein